MKRFAALALILCIGLFTIGCEKPADKKPTDDAKVEADADAAADAGSEAKEEEKTE